MNFLSGPINYAPHGADVGLSSERRALGKHSFHFSGITNISSVLFPYAFAFRTSSSPPREAPWKLYGLSALALLPPKDNVSANSSALASFTLLALSDRSFLFSAALDISEGLQLSSIAWEGRWTLVEGADEGGRPLDTEGLAVLPSGEVLVSDEPGLIYRLPPRQTWPPPSSGATLSATVLHRLPDYVRRGMPRNLGLESLATPFAVNQVARSGGQQSSDGLAVVTGIEGPLAQDAPEVRRLLELDAATGEVRRQVAFTLPPNNPALFVSDLAALDVDANGPLDSTGSSQGQMLALVRGWGPSLGNEVRLYLLNIEGASQVNDCEAIVDGRSVSPGPQSTSNGSMHSSSGLSTTPANGSSSTSCRLSEVTLVRKELIFRWTPSLPLAGGLHVDNYEGLAVVPPAALGFSSFREMGGVLLMLVNDNNDNPKQIGTQFLLMQLAFENSSYPAGIAPHTALSDRTTTIAPETALSSSALETPRTGNQSNRMPLFVALALCCAALFACVIWIASVLRSRGCPLTWSRESHSKYHREELEEPQEQVGATVLGQAAVNDTSR